MNKFRPKNGFTFIELLVVIVLIGVLSAIGLVSYASLSKKGRDDKRQADLELIRGALELYKAENSSYPDTANCLLDGVIGQYLSGNEVPTEPKIGWSAYQCVSDGSVYCLRACFESEAASGGCTLASTNCSTGNTYFVTSP